MGMNETDLLFGGFADRYLANLSDDQLDRLEALLAQVDLDLFNWATGKIPPPPDLDTDVFRLLRAYMRAATDT
jgi:antitoxin CptB